MPLDPRTPVLVGVGQVGQRSEVDVPISQRTEPVALMADALRAAADDCHGDGGGEPDCSAEPRRFGSWFRCAGDM